MKNKKIGMGLLSGLMVLSLALPVQAETFYGDDNWNVTFTSNREMVSTFTTADINDVVGGMQPGDNVIISLDLKNTNPTPTDWYMQNEVLYSLEDRSANSQTGGGAYTYRLVYIDKEGTENILFDSDTVGGEANEDILAHIGEGLHEATNALEDYFYLDTLYNGDGGSITLEVALDGETQGNHYQDTLADLQMEFAVELRDDLPDQPPGPNPTPTPNPNPTPTPNPNPTPTPTPGTNPTPTPPGNTPERVSDDDPPPTPPPGRGTEVVKTSDDSQLPLLIAISGITGVILLVYCIYCFKEHKKRKNEKGGISG